MKGTVIASAHDIKNSKMVHIEFMHIKIPTKNLVSLPTLNDSQHDVFARLLEDMIAFRDERCCHVDCDFSTMMMTKIMKITTTTTTIILYLKK